MEIVVFSVVKTTSHSGTVKVRSGFRRDVSDTTGAVMEDFTHGLAEHGEFAVIANPETVTTGCSVFMTADFTHHFLYSLLLVTFFFVVGV